MTIETISTDRFVFCPRFGEPMRFARTMPERRGLPAMETFEWRLCRLAVTAEHVVLQSAKY